MVYRPENQPTCSIKMPYPDSRMNVNRIERQYNRQILIRHWKYVTGNIEPRLLLKNLKEAQFIDERSIVRLGDKSKLHQAYLVFIAASRALEHGKPFDDFNAILQKMDTRGCSIANRLNEPFIEHEIQQVTEREIRLLTVKMKNHRSLLEKNLTYEVLMEMVGDFVQNFIFDFDTVEKIICDLPARTKEAYTHFVNGVIDNLNRGSYQCLVTSMKSTEGNQRRFHAFLKKIECDVACLDEDKISVHISLESGTLRENPTGNMANGIMIIESLSTDAATAEVTHRAIKENSSLEKNLSEHCNLYVEEKKTGSVVLYLTSYSGNVRKIVMSKILNGDFTKWLEQLMNEDGIKSKLPHGKHKLEVRFYSTVNDYREIDDNTDRSEQWKSDEYIISANRTFLQREIDVLSITEAFASKGINCFENAKIDSEKRADTFLDTLNTKNLWGMFLEILKENKMTYILDRLDKCKRSYSADTAKLKQNILQHHSNIADHANIESIRQVFIDRQVFDSKLFDDIYDRLNDSEDQVRAVIREILKSGPFAMMTLVDALYISNLDEIAEKLLSSPAAVVRSMAIPFKKEENLKLERIYSLKEALNFIGVFEVDVQYEEKRTTIASTNPTLKFEENLRLPPLKRPPSPVDQNFRDDVKAWKKIRNETIPRMDRLVDELRSANEKIKTARTVRNWTVGLSLFGGLLLAPFTGGGSLAAAAAISGGTTGVIYFIEMYIEKDVLETTQEGINKDKAETLRLRTRITSYQGGNKRTEEFVHDLLTIALEAIFLLSQNPLTAFIASFVDNNSMSLLKAIDKVVELRIQLDIELKKVEVVEGRFY